MNKRAWGAALALAAVLSSSPARITYAGRAKGVTFLIPNATDSRWSQAARQFVEQLTRRMPGVRWIVLNAHGHEAAQAQQARDAVDGGAKVLVVAPVNPAAAGQIVSYASARGVPVIAYDRPIEARRLSLFVGFNPLTIGIEQGQFIRRHVRRGNLVIINGPADDDIARAQYRGVFNLTLEKQVLAHRYTVTLTSYADGWSPAAARHATITAMFNTDKRLAGIVAQSDALASGVREALFVRLHFRGRIVVTGSGASLEGLRAVLQGRQSMTIYKPVSVEAGAAARAAAAFLREKPLPRSLKGRFRMRAGIAQAALFRPTVITAPLLRSTVVRDGLVTTRQLCEGLTPFCERYHILESPRKRR